MDEKEQDLLKEKIKDFTVKIFKSEDIETDDAHLKKDLQNDINTNVGREFFTSLLSKNTSNIILLKDKEFNLLGTIPICFAVSTRTSRDRESLLSRSREVSLVSR